MFSSRYHFAISRPWHSIRINRWLSCWIHRRTEDCHAIRSTIALNRRTGYWFFSRAVLWTELCLVEREGKGCPFFTGLGCETKNASSLSVSIDSTRIHVNQLPLPPKHLFGFGNEPGQPYKLFFSTLLAKIPRVLWRHASAVWSCGISYCSCSLFSSHFARAGVVRWPNPDRRWERLMPVERKIGLYLKWCSYRISFSYGVNKDWIFAASISQEQRLQGRYRRTYHVLF